MMRSDMPKQVMAYRNGGGIPSLATVPMETTMAGQPHRLAYVNPIEEEMMKQMGGAGLPGPGGIPSYFLHNAAARQRIKNFFTGGSDDEDDSNSSSEGPASIGVESNDDGPGNVGFVDSLLMGLGLKDKTPGYIAATANSIALNQGSAAANNYISGLDSDDVPTGTFDAINAASDTITASGLSYDNSQQTGGDSGGSGAATTTAVADTTADTTTTFVLNDDQLNAQSDYLSRVADVQGQYTPAQLQDFQIRQQLSQGYTIKPTVSEFMSITGADEELAKALIQNNVGNYDLRDWSKIMATDNPLEAASAATAALYMTPGLYGAGQTIGTNALVENFQGNVIGETDQLYAYTTPFSAYDQYGVGNVGIGIQTPDGVQLTQLGPLGSANFASNLARFGYGAEDLQELVPYIQDYYGQNFANTASSNYDSTDPFGYISNIQSNAPTTTTGALDFGQGFLYQTTPGYFGQSALNIVDQDVLDQQNAAAANQAAQQAAAAEANQYSSGQPITGSAGQNTGMQTYSALVPSTGTSTAGIAGLPSTNTATASPYAFTAYTPGTFNPVVNPLVLPPLG